jgi:adenylyltransferase/sulfurtransferase
MSSSASEILQELESLKNEKTKIEHKISLLEAQLKDINLQKQVSASSNGSSPYPTNGLEPHMIHRYSRHLVLPSFGVQGTYS